MGYLKNTWVGYLSRSVEQILTSVLVTLGVKVPEMTDHTPNNPYIRNLEIFAGMTETAGYYVDNAGREAHLDSARLFRSGISHARKADYQVIGNLGYSVDVVFTLSGTDASDVIIPSGTIVSVGASGIEYVTQAAATVLAGNLVSNPVGSVQYIVATGIAMGNMLGVTNEELLFTDKIMHNSLTLTIGGDTWVPKETLAFSLPTDKHFVQNVNKTGGVIAQFGNANPSGLIPPSNQPVLASYKITLGSAGKANAGDIDTIVSTLTLPGTLTATVTNPVSASGGADTETLDQLKDHIPYAYRTLRRAVTKADYEAVTEMAPGVARAGVIFNCGKTILDYIVPDGGGIASSVLIGTTQTYIDARKMITTQVKIYSAGEVHVIIDVLVNATSSYFNADVQALVEAALQDWLSYNHQNIGGVLYLSDLYEKIDTTEGVENSIINFWYVEPYALPLDTTAIPLDWSVAINAGSTSTVEWTILFLNNTDYQLIRNGVLLGTFNVGNLVGQAELDFTVNTSTYANGDSYSFVTYPYNPTNIVLIEPSLPMTELVDLNVTVQGGL